MIVVDTNVIAYFYLHSVKTESAQALHRLDHEWGVPILWRSEFRSILTMYIRKEILDLNQSLEIFELAQNRFHGLEYSVDTASILQLASHSDCSAYDCEFVSLAKDVGAPLVTEDQQVLDAFPEIAFSIGQYLKMNEEEL
ncbi:MAG: type II toxin-antitoxin system VapC family toxin [Candidatus Marinimicrobia bacterium]|nr:type II toxin-antitoxin system VapC family toxin [Candidatus Neomarinimicrobiota bacterium]MCF7827777.1 type II toxin-antitoxin system VapC family toxin [Candidatus Neomarinimicrobiota bacterium]MCF7879468.1 type II toxin-antitoxin system VapC family toxin [Candidatus Neomarinimicrobiota bacterium]